MKEVLTAFDRDLARRRLRYEAVVVGGAALLILGVIERDTQDVDCLDPTIPDAVKRAARRFARGYRGPGAPLKEDWLNNGPASLAKDLPPGWRDRTQPLFAGKGLVLRTLGRMDFLRAKLYAYCDRQQDLQDCTALRPILEELRECLPWLVERDTNPLWPRHVRTSLRALAKELGYGFDA